MKLWSERGHPIPKDKRNNALVRELAVVRNDRAVVRDSVRPLKLDRGRVAILFTLHTARLGEQPRAAIRDVEPVALVYRPRGVGIRAPAVFSERIDFPRDLVHLNPVAEDSPASICLAREGHQALYDRHGVHGILSRLSDWLRDAKTGSLDHGDWEPVPVTGSSTIAALDGGELQEFVRDAGDAVRWAIAQAFVTDAHVIGLRGPEIGGSAAVRKTLDRIETDRVALAKWEAVPALLIWQESSRVERHPSFRPCGKGQDVLGLLDRTGLRGPFQEAIAHLAADGRSLPEKLVLLVGVRRPFPLREECFGLSNDLQARKLELRGFTIAEAASGLEGGRVYELRIVHMPDRKLLSHVSGVEPNRPITLLGYGALGSAVGGFLARMGVSETTVVDCDFLQPHNLARHGGLYQDIGKRKSLIHERIQAAVNPIDASPVRVETLDITEAANERVVEFVAAQSIVIDATASDGVRRALCDKPIGRVCRIEMYDGGRLGVQTIEGEGRNPDSLDLYYELCALGGSSEAIRDWLLGELRERETATIETGFGCASPTVRLPYWVIAGHASSFMPAISRLLESKSTQAGVGVHALDSNRRPSGWEWYDVAPFRVFQERGWTIRIAAHIEGEMAQLAAAKAPHETGGYLYGGIDPMEHRITIVRLTGEPPGTRSGPTFLELPPAGTSDEEKKLYHQSAHRLTPVACWHSHPGSSAGMSRKDRATARRFMEENQARGTPTLLLVIGRDGMTVNVC